MEQIEIKVLCPQKIGESPKRERQTLTVACWKKIGTSPFFRPCLYVGTLALVYHLMGLMVQQVDPTAAWLDTGTLSIPLFAAWCCLLGIGIAGLLPAMFTTIGKKGGIRTCNKNSERHVQLLVFVAYIVLLCALL